MFVVFADLCGFTEYSERLGDRAAAELAARFSLRAMRAGRHAGARPVTTVGDAVIFVCIEAPVAVRAAVGLLDEFAASFPLAIHVGVASGDVVERDGDIFGFPVNLAAHLADEAGPGEALLTAGVVAVLPPGHGSTAAGSRDVGLSRPIELFSLDPRAWGDVA